MILYDIESLLPSAMDLAMEDSSVGAGLSPSGVEHSLKAKPLMPFPAQ